MQKKGSAESKEGRENANLPPVMNTLKVELLNNGKFNTIVPNAREPAPFETEFFKGVSMLVVRTAPIDAHFNNFFEGRKRLFEVQVQGKFKRLPQGEIYVGAEASLKMELGLITRSIARAAINLCSSMVGDLHSSLGDNKNGELFQLPHLVAPMFITFDKIICTQPGEKLPPMGEPFVEDLEYRKKRLKFRSIKDANVDLETTYSFSVNTSNINLLNWTLVGIPMVKPMDLRIFLQESAIRLVGYEIPTTVLAQNNGDHPLKQVNYVFNMNLTSVDPAAVVDLPTAPGTDDGESSSDDEPDALGLGKKQRAGEEVGLLDHQEPDLDLEQERDGEGEGDDASTGSDSEGEDPKDQKPFQGKRSNPPSQPGSPRPHNSNAASSASAKGVSGWIRKHIGRDRGDRDRDRGTGERDHQTTEAAEIEVAEVGESSEYSLTDYEMESTGDLAYCPGCLEMNHEGRRRVLYFIPLPESHERSATVSVAGDELDLHAPRLRPFSEIAKILPLVPIPRMHKNKRLSSLEKRRRQVVESYRVLLKSDPSSAPYARFMAFLNQVTPADRDYLEGNTSVQQHVRQQRGGVQDSCWEGCVGMATSRRHWVEYHLLLTRSEACFYHKQHNNRASQRVPRRPALRINMSQVVSVQPMRFQDIPLQGFAFFQVETFSRVYYFMVRSDIQLHEWIEAFVSILGKDVLHSPFDENYYNSSGASSGNNTPASARFSEPDGGAYLAKSACWRLDKKRIFNYRRIIFNPAAMSSKYAGMSPNTFIEAILANVLFLSNADSNKTNAFQWVKFMDEISWLQTINVSRLSENERVAFFLNLYHVMVLHGSLVVGPPPAWNYWNAFFNNITYMFGYEIISIADVEHNILRASMARPSSLSIIPIPQHQFPGLAVTQRDFRMDFCINNGSKSMPSMVPIYTPDNLDELLDEMTALMLLSNVEIDLSKKSIILPKVSLQDFTTRKAAAAGTPATPLDCLRILMQYFAPEDRALAMRILSDNIHVAIRFKNQSLRCRKLRVYSSHAGLPMAVVAAQNVVVEPPEEVDIVSSEFLVDMYQEFVA